MISRMTFNKNEIESKNKIANFKNISIDMVSFKKIISTIVNEHD